MAIILKTTDTAFIINGERFDKGNLKHIMGGAADAYCMIVDEANEDRVVVPMTLYGTYQDGDNSNTPYASAAALDDYLTENMYEGAGGSGGTVGGALEATQLLVLSEIEALNDKIIDVIIGGSQAQRYANLASLNGTVVQAGACYLTTVAFSTHSNTASDTYWLHIYDKGTAPSAAVDTPKMSLFVGAGGVCPFRDITFEGGVRFVEGISFIIATDYAAIGVPAGASRAVANFVWKQ